MTGWPDVTNYGPRSQYHRTSSWAGPGRLGPGSGRVARRHDVRRRLRPCPRGARGRSTVGGSTTGRSSGFRLLTARGRPSRGGRAPVAVGIRGPGRSQRRPRTGFAPVSLFRRRPRGARRTCRDGDDDTPAGGRVQVGGRFHHVAALTTPQAAQRAHPAHQIIGAHEAHQIIMRTRRIRSSRRRFPKEFSPGAKAGRRGGGRARTAAAPRRLRRRRARIAASAVGCPRTPVGRRGLR
jgi:hypothetical protein